MWENYKGLFDVWNLKAGFPIEVAIGLGIIMAVLLLVCVWTDIKKMLILDVITIPAIIISALLSPIMWQQTTAHLVAGVGAGIVFAILANVKIRGEYAMGYGDVKLYAWLGFVFAQAVIVIMILASVIGLIAAGIQQLRNDETVVGKQIPHAPHIVLATFIVAAVCAIVS